MTVIPFPAPSRSMPVSRRGEAARLEARGTMETWMKRRADRRELRKLLWGQPDSVLADAGYTRAALRAEIAKPFWRA